ncbi:MAG: PSP1 C-terminal domain-containing protein [Faecalibacterium sp.]
MEAEYTLDRSKIMFYFTADGRVDFRELVKDLAGIFHTRIEAAPDRRARREQDDRRSGHLRPAPSAAAAS